MQSTNVSPGVMPPGLNEMEVPGKLLPVLRVDVRGQCSQDIQVAVFLVEVQPVAHHELIRDVAANVFHVDIYGQRIWLTQEGHNLDGCRAPRLQVRLQPGECQTGIDDILYDQHVTIHQIFFEVFQDPHYAGGFRSGPIGRYRHKIYGNLRLHSPREIGHNHQCALEHAYEQNVLALIIAVNSDSQVLNDAINFFAVE